MLHDSMPSHSPCHSPHDELPQVDIRAVAFHRWRTLKWLVSFVDANSGCPRQGRTRTFAAAVQLAKTWSLDYWAEHCGNHDGAEGAPPTDLDHRDVDKDSPTFQR